MMQFDDKKLKYEKMLSREGFEAAIALYEACIMPLRQRIYEIFVKVCRLIRKK